MVLQIAWLVFLGNYFNSNYVKTTAKVVDLGYVRDGTYPVYEYFDTSGKRHVAEDRYSGAMGRDNPLYFIFGSELGDEVALYYDENSPENFNAIAGVWTYAVIFLPLFVVALPLFFTAVILIVFKIRTFNPSVGRFE